MSQHSAVTTSSLNLRLRPNPEAEPPLTVLPDQAQITLLGNHRTWLRIRHDTSEGWVNGTYTRPLSDSPDTHPLWTTRVMALNLNLRPAPDPAAEPPLTTLPNDVALDVIGYTVVRGDELWLQVRHGDQTGFINSKYTSSDPALEPAGADAELAGLLARTVLSTAEVRRARALIAQERDPQRRGDFYEQLQSRVPYRSQRDNQVRDTQGRRIEPVAGAMCNLTSLAMCLDYLGIANPDPELQFEDALERMRMEHNLPARTTSEGWGGVAARLGAQVAFLGTGVREGRDWYTRHVREALRSGHAVMLSIGGHICRVQAVTEQGLVVDDPYGKARLLPGEQGAWKYLATNQYGVEGQAVGQDVVWPWADVEQHTMRWIAQIALNVPRSRGATPQVPEGEEVYTRLQPASAPAERFDDDGVVGREDEPPVTPVDAPVPARPGRAAVRVELPPQPYAPVPGPAAAARREDAAPAPAPASASASASAPAPAPQQQHQHQQGAPVMPQTPAASEPRPERLSWTPEQYIQVLKEAVTAILAVLVVFATVLMAYGTLGLAGDAAKVSDAKDVLLLLLGLAGVVVGYYFGRVPADARAAQAQEQAVAATAHAEQVNAQAGTIAEQADDIVRRLSAGSPSVTRGPAGDGGQSLDPQLERLRAEVRELLSLTRRR